MSSEALSFGARLRQLAAERSDEPALTFRPRDGSSGAVFSWRQLDDAARRAAQLFAENEVDMDSMVVVGLPNCPEHLISVFATWKLGACALPLNPRLPDRERNELLGLAAPAVVVADWANVPTGRLLSRQWLGRAKGASALPDVVPHPGKAIGSGGSTGRQKIIVDPNPLIWSGETSGRGLLPRVGFRPDMRQLVCGALHHNSPFSVSVYGLMAGHHVVLTDRFDANHVVSAIEEFKIQFLYLAPTMMMRIARLPDIELRDLSSLEALFHTAAPCPPWLKRRWIELLGPDRVYEAFGATEAVGQTVIRGDEWLEHPGSVGRAVDSEVRILSEAGRDLPAGEVGEIFMRLADRSGPTYRYLGAEPSKTVDDWTSVGDLGSLDQNGYLYPADRRLDMIITGGVNVYPAEVEAVLSQHPDVVDAVVIGLPDEEWGRRVHALLATERGRPIPASELDAHCRALLSSHKRPRSYEFVADFPREESGKIRRSAIATERAEAGGAPGSAATGWSSTSRSAG